MYYTWICSLLGHKRRTWMLHPLMFCQCLIKHKTNGIVFADFSFNTWLTKTKPSTRVRRPTCAKCTTREIGNSSPSASASSNNTRTSCSSPKLCLSPFILQIKHIWRQILFENVIWNHFVLAKSALPKNHKIPKRNIWNDLFFSRLKF